jgi:hypothetical protein
MPSVRSLENILFIEIRLLYYSRMSRYGFTDYFENEVLRKRPYLEKEWCQRVVENPIRHEPQEHNRFRFWGLGPDRRIGRKISQGNHPSG